VLLCFRVDGPANPGQEGTCGDDSSHNTDDNSDNCASRYSRTFGGIADCRRDCASRGRGGAEVKEDVEVEVDVVETVDELVGELFMLVGSAADPPSVKTTAPRPSNTIPMFVGAALWVVITAIAPIFALNIWWKEASSTVVLTNVGAVIPRIDCASRHNGLIVGFIKVIWGAQAFW
jgi:hypothetical protein